MKHVLSEKPVLVREPIHPVLKEYMEKLRSYERDIDLVNSEPRWFYNVPKSVYDISIKNLDRYQTIMNTIIHYAEAIGCEISDNLYISKDYGGIEIRIIEDKDTVPYSRKNHSPNFYPESNRKYDKVFNGKLKIKFDENDFVRDGKFTLEEQLDLILYKVFTKMNSQHILNQKRKKEKDFIAGEIFANKLPKLRILHEQELTDKLIKQAEYHQKATMIRQLISDADNADPMWKEWANRQADKLDPIKCGMINHLF